MRLLLVVQMVFFVPTYFSLIPRLMHESLGIRLLSMYAAPHQPCSQASNLSYAVEGLVKLLHRMTLGGVALVVNCSATARKPCLPTSTQCLPDVILRRSFTRSSTMLAVIEGLGTRLMQYSIHRQQPCSQTLMYEPGNEAKVGGYRKDHLDN